VPASAVTDGAPVVVAFEDLELRDTALVATESDITGVGFFHVTDTTTFPFDPDLRWHERLAEGPHSPTEIGAVVAAAVLADGTPVWTGELSVDVSSDGALVIGRSSLHGPRVFELARVLEQGFTHLEARYGEHLAMLSITAD
jgi:hypothetical protein